MRNFRRNFSGGRRRPNNRSFGRSRSNGSASGGNYQRSNKVDLLNPMMFVRRAVESIQPTYQPDNNFNDFPLDGTVKNNLFSRGFEKPTAIQDQAILPIIQGRDLVGVANTGTGKTAAFLLPLITKVLRDRSQKVLVVTPTRELALQIQDELKIFAKGTGVYSVLCIGGASVNVQSRELLRQPNFVIGTPGRLKDLQERRCLNLNHYNNVVLDEVDRMLDMGFIADIRRIISFLPAKRQSLFFSATIPKATEAVMRSFLTDPVMVSVKTGPTAQNVDQDIIRTEGKDKVNILHELLIRQEFRKVLIFGRTKWGINKLEANLSKRGFRVASLHGNKTQGQRLRALRMLKSNEVRILLATDVASRGIDIDDITHVINFDVPNSYDDYVHRIGRTGRADKKGVALTFVD